MLFGGLYNRVARSVVTLLMLAQVRLFVAIVALVVIVLGGTVTCAKQMVGDEQREGLMTGKTIDTVLKQHTDRLTSLPGVVGTAVGECEGKPCIQVLVVKKTPELMNKIPPKLDGFVVVIEETGEIRALESD
jgi:hypothetical protein